MRKVLRITLKVMLWLVGIYIAMVAFVLWQFSRTGMEVVPSFLVKILTSIP